MKSILLINFKRLGDILSTAHVANELAIKGNKVSILVFSEFTDAATQIRGIDKVYSIDRKKIETYMKSELFHDALALDALYRELAPVQKVAWSQVVNISNDTFSARLSSFIAGSARAEACGVSFNANQTISYSNDWSVLYNDVMTKVSNSPIHFQDIYRRLSGLEARVQSPEFPLYTDEKYDKQTEKNFQIIKENFGSLEHSKVIGIQAKSSDENKDVPFRTTVQLVDHLLNKREEYIPVILIAPLDKEREFARRLNDKFENRLITIESGLRALSSVVKSLDALITPDTLTKHVADAFNTPCVEVSLGKAPLFKQGSINPKSLILTQRLDKRMEKPGRDRHLVEATDIINSLDYIFDHSQMPQISSEFTLYRPATDSLGHSLKAIAGNIDHDTETFRVLARNYTSRMLCETFDKNMGFRGFESFRGEAQDRYLDSQRVYITEAMKSLLATLRALRQAKEPGSSSKMLINLIDSLFELSHNESSLASIPLSFFRAKIENMPTQATMSENIKSFEGYLFTLKTQMQTLLTTLNDFESFCHNKTSASRQNPEVVNFI